MKHNRNTMEEFGKPIVVNGKTQRYKNGDPKKHGINADGSHRQIRKDKKSTEPTRTGNI